MVAGGWDGAWARWGGIGLGREREEDAMRLAERGRSGWRCGFRCNLHSQGRKVECCEYK